MDINLILNFWFPERDKYQSFWFDHSKDTYIKETFYTLCLYAKDDNEFYNNLENYSSGHKLAYIILLDQFMRNISDVRYDDRALLITECMLKNKEYNNFDRIDYRLFILLPLRHTKKSSNLYRVLEYLDEFSYNFPNSKLLELFKQNTLKGFTLLQDELELYTRADYPLDIKYDRNVIAKDYNKILDIKSNIESEILYRNVLDFIKVNNYKDLCVSLSGGVDSMVLSYILCYMYNKGILDNICAIHLNYKNREESNQESNMIKYWCSLLMIPLIYREIKHMKRSTTKRDFYESETKRIRFALYRLAQNELNYDGICLGHHGDDLEENVMMNILKRINILELGGMNEKSEQDGIILLRPMLNNFKDEIYRFAHNYKIIYTKDTTPPTSQRGILRNRIFPILENFGFNKNLYILGKQAEVYKRIYNKYINGKMEYRKFGFIINDIIDIDRDILKQILVNCYHKYGFNMIKTTNLNFCYNNITRTNYIMSFSNGSIGYLVNGQLCVYLFGNKKWQVRDTDKVNNDINDYRKLLDGYFIVNKWNIKKDKILKSCNFGKMKRYIECKNNIENNYEFSLC